LEKKSSFALSGKKYDDLSWLSFLLNDLIKDETWILHFKLQSISTPRHLVDSTHFISLSPNLRD
jgi:hypothetical protein